MRKNNIIFLILALFLFVGCSNADTKDDVSSGDFSISEFNGETLKIVGGSENKELEPMIEKYCRKNKQNIEIDYLGSLDIMRMLQSGETEYDAVWPASTIWLTLGDKNHLLKHTQTTSITPVVFGIKDSLAESLGFKNRDVKIEDIIREIESGNLKFAMTSATQSNSGASAYLGFLTAISENPDGLSKEDLESEKLQTEITTLLGGVNRSSGSSNWLVDLFLNGDYDAMVNYEALIIKTNNELISQGKEPLYVIYPVDGLSISDSPLSYIDKGDEKKEEMFLKFQEYILSDEGQNEIQKTGKRSAFGTVDKENEKVFDSSFGIDTKKVLSPIRFPKADVIEEALNLYQSSFKKPSLTIYVLDYSGSMSGKGYDQLIDSLSEVLLPENARENMLLGTSRDITYAILFSNEVFGIETARGNGEEMTNLYKNISENYHTGGGTSLFEAISEAIDILKSEYKDDIENYTPAIVILSDGKSNGKMDISDLQKIYADLGEDVPIFSIMFGNADDEELKKIAEISRARVFDGRKDMIGAFRSVRGYN